MQAIYKRLIIWGAVAAVLALALVAAFRPRPVQVDSIVLQPGPMQVTVDEEGETRVHDVFAVSAPVAGRLHRIEAHVGDGVQAGETVLARIEPADPTLLDPRSEAQARATVQAAESALSLAEAEIEQAQAEYEFALAEHRRARDLVGGGTISVRDAEAAERAFRSSRAALATSQAALQVRRFELERARAQLLSPAATTAARADCECVSVTAPVSGEVLFIPNESERVVQAGEPLLQIGDPTDLEIVVDFLSTDAVRIEPGQVVLVERWGGDVELYGRVRRVEPFGFTKVSALGIEEQRVNVIIDLTSPREVWRALGHGYQLEARVVLWQSDAVLSVPLTALFREGEQWAAFVLQDGRARLRILEIGRRNGIAAQVLSGLQAGDRVILHPSNRVQEGTRVASG